MKIDELISSGNALVGLRAADKAGVIRELAGQAALKLGLASEEVEEELIRREDLGSTGIGNGVALPHARLAGLSHPFGFIARLKRPVEFEAVDGKPVDIVVLVLMPALPDTGKPNALACVARTLREEPRLSRLRQAQDDAEFYRALVA